MNTQQKNQILKGIYAQAIQTIIKAVENRSEAVHAYETYLNTVEDTLQVFNADFDLERDLKLVSRGLNADILRYITRLETKAQAEQMDFYSSVERSL